MLGVIIMDPCTLNVFIAALTNHFYTTLSRNDFISLGIVLRELSKSMLTTLVYEDFCRPPNKASSEEIEDLEIADLD